MCKQAAKQENCLFCTFHGRSGNWYLSVIGGDRQSVIGQGRSEARRNGCARDAVGVNIFVVAAQASLLFQRVWNALSWLSLSLTAFLKI